MATLPVRMKDEAGIDAVLAEFEAGSLSKREWTHGTHLDETGSEAGRLIQSQNDAAMRDSDGAHVIAVLARS
jgi:hypothetical protein